LKLERSFAFGALLLTGVFACSHAAAAPEEAIRADGRAPDSGASDDAAAAELSGLIGSLDLGDPNARHEASEATEKLGERATAALMIRALAMITTTSLVKPEKALFAGTTPTATPARSAITATTS